MAFHPTSGSPLPPQMAFQHPMAMGTPPFQMHPGRPSLMPMPGTMPHPMAPGPVRLPLQPPPIGVPFVGAPAMVPHTQHIISAPPVSADPSKQLRARVPLALSAADMKVATTVFVGNISDKASDTLVRQILLRCGRIEGWKRVQDASGKLQGFGFCEYTNPESTLRALRLLHDFKLGDKNLVVKVDSKTRTDLLKYLMRKKRAKQNLPIDDDTIDKEVAEDGGTSVLSQEIDSDMKAEDERLMDGVNTLVRENIEVLSSSQPSEDVRLKQDVTDALISMAKQAGNVDPDSTLDEVDMEDDMKTLVSDEIKKFRQSYKVGGAYMGVPLHYAPHWPLRT